MKLQLATNAKYGVLMGKLALQGRIGPPGRALADICASFSEDTFRVGGMGVKLQERETYHRAGISPQISVLYAERTGRIVT